MCPNADYFFVGLIFDNISPTLGALYPLVLGIIVFGVGYYLLVNLADPNWELGKKEIPVADYRDYHYYSQSPQFRTTKNLAAHSSSAPMNEPCSECGKKDLLPFRCTSCKKIYCVEHRLPEKHFCVVENQFKK